MPRTFSLWSLEFPISYSINGENEELNEGRWRQGEIIIFDQPGQRLEVCGILSDSEFSASVTIWTSAIVNILKFNFFFLANSNYFSGTFNFELTKCDCIIIME